MEEKDYCGHSSQCTGRVEECHSCPYAAEIYGDDSEDHCDCCAACTQECAWDV